MSKRESHQRWMGVIPRHEDGAAPRRVYTNCSWTFELQDSQQLWSDEERGPMADTDNMEFELWHELPPSIPAISPLRR